MATSTRARLRKAWFYVHMWVGVGLFIALVPICVTGAYEVWHEELDRVANPVRYETTAGDLKPASVYLAAAQAAFGERATAASVRFPEHAGDPVMVAGPISKPPPEAGQRRPPSLTAWVDPGSAKVLDVADLSKSYRQVIHRIHGSLMIPEIGRKTVGWMGWALFASCVSGLWLWWPRGGGSVAKGLRYRRTGSTMLNLHYTGGFWICIPLAVLALSGVFISFPQSTRGALSAVAEVAPQQQRGGGPGGGGGRPLAQPALPIDQVVQMARAAAPGRDLVSVNLPSRGKEPSWRVQFAGDPSPTTVEVKDAPGAVAELQPERPVAGGDALLRLNRRIHDGEDTGVIWRTIITLAGLIPAVLGVTGVIVWARRQIRKARLRQPELEPAAAE